MRDRDAHQHRRLVEVMADTVGRILEYLHTRGRSALSKRVIGSTQLRIDLMGERGDGKGVNEREER